MSDLPLVRELVPAPDPVACCERLEGLPFRIWLDSATDARHLGRYSFLTADPCGILRASGRAADHVVLPGGTRTPLDSTPLEALRALLAPFRTPAVPGIPPFQGGAVGYIGYEFGGTLERLPPPSPVGLDIPDLAFGLYDWTLAWDHLERRAWLVSTGIPDEGEARRVRAEVRLASVLERLSGVESLHTGGSEHGGTTGSSRAVDRHDGFDDRSLSAAHFPGLRSSLGRDDYLAAVARVREYILAGDIYQANIAQRFSLSFSHSPWMLYKQLRSHNPAPFSAFLDLGDLAIASVSPERFLRLTSTGTAEARPIKGTRPRGATPDDDAALCRELLASEKDRAEHVMIVDLMRNDLSRVCAPGTVRVPEFLALEQYSTVNHLVSTVTGQLEPDRDAIDLLAAAFPGGSITGAPKIRAMEIIAELEPVRRDVYCGTIGYLSVTGALDASIVIRTVLIKDGLAHCSAGGGIVADSHPQGEYAESWDKARGLLEVLGANVPAAARDT